MALSSAQDFVLNVSEICSCSGQGFCFGTHLTVPGCSCAMGGLRVFPGLSAAFILEVAPLTLHFCVCC